MIIFVVGLTWAPQQFGSTEPREEITRSVILAKLERYAQPMGLCSPSSYKAQYGIDLLESVFFRVENHAIVSRTFKITEETNQKLVIEGVLEQFQKVEGGNSTMDRRTQV